MSEGYHEMSRIALPQDSQHQEQQLQDLQHHHHHHQQQQIIATRNNVSSAHRPRKSNLTQQQKNKKRQRATTEQLEVLKREFNRNPTPTAKKREEIGQAIDMTERSVQIWFQNKRAKVKLAKKQSSYNDECRGYNLHGNSSMILQSGYYSSPGMSRFASPLDSTQSTPPGFLTLDQASVDMSSLGYYGANLSEYANSIITAPPIIFTCSELIIGSWSRALNMEVNDLVVSYQPSHSILTYSVFGDNRYFKMMVPFKSVEGIELGQDNQRQQVGHIFVKLNDPKDICYFIWDEGTKNWREQDDFTIGKQASTMREHHWMGLNYNFRMELGRLYSFQPSKVPAGIGSLTPPMTSTIQPPDWPDDTNNNVEKSSFELDSMSELSHPLSQSLQTLPPHPSTLGTGAQFVENEPLPPPPSHTDISSLPPGSIPPQYLPNDQQYLFPERLETKSTPADLHVAGPAYPPSELENRNSSMSDSNLVSINPGGGSHDSTFIKVEHNGNSSEVDLFNELSIKADTGATVDVNTKDEENLKRILESNHGLDGGEERETNMNFNGHNYQEKHNEYSPLDISPLNNEDYIKSEDANNYVLGPNTTPVATGSENLILAELDEFSFSVDNENKDEETTNPQNRTADINDADDYNNYSGSFTL